MKLTSSLFKVALQGSKVEYQYSPGGFPTSSRRVFEYDSLTKVKSKVSRLSNLNDVLKRIAATKLIFGTASSNSPYAELTTRAKELGATPEQLAEANSITWETYEDIKKEIFQEFQY
jgi:hypothetical protein